MSKLFPLAFTVMLLAAACVPYAPPGGTATPAGTPTQPTTAVAGSALSFKSTTLQLGTGESRSLANILTLNGQPIDAVTAALLQWQIDDPARASLTTDGTLKGLSKGSTRVVVSSRANPADNAQLTLNVVANGGAVQIQITPETAVMQPGENLALTAAVHLADGTVNSNVQWSSSDNTIATVNPTNGSVSALALGRVTIRATYTLDSSYQQVAEIVVVKDKNEAVPSAVPSTVVFGGAPSPSPTPVGQRATPAPAGEWTAQLSGVKDNLTCVDFVDAKTGFVMGEKGVFLSTSDGGATWKSDYPLSLGFQHVSKMDFASASLGLAMVSGNKLYRTTDGGKEWVSVDTLVNLRWFRCFGSTCYAIANGEILKSTDGFATVQNVNAMLGDKPEINAVAVNGSQLWVIANNKIYKEVPDVGWASFTFSPSEKVLFPTERIGYALSNGYISVTTDGGKNWNGLEGGSGAADMGWADDKHGMVLTQAMYGRGGSTAAFATSDGGLTFGTTSFTPNPSGDLHAIAHPAPDAGWIVGAGGQIYSFKAAAQ